MMNIYLIGHRGAGKTTLLNKIKEAHILNDYLFFDLDLEIEKQTKKIIEDIFDKEGESKFRSLEKEIFNKILSKNDSQKIIMSVGAGFSEEFPIESDVVWVRRETDKEGRVFKNRPKINSNNSAFDDYMSLFSDRDSRYKKISTKVITLPEGNYDNELISAFFLGDQPKNFNKPFVTSLSEKDLNLKMCQIEIRDDLEGFNKSSLETANLISFRKKIEKKIFVEHIGKRLIDVDYELFKKDIDFFLNIQNKKNLIISLHDKKYTKDFFKIKMDSHLKLSIDINSFEELMTCHGWWQEDPDNRSFLPRSENGRWRWYRNHFGPLMKLNFVKNYQGSAPDQPFVYEQIGRSSSEKFAAILGDPVSHSLTPTEQRSFFKEFNMNVYPVILKEGECTKNTLHLLYKFGLRAAAVTSPLKIDMYKCSDTLTIEAEELKAVNTIFIDNKFKIHSHNTDQMGLKKFIIELRERLEFKSSVIGLWGSGGVKSSVLKIFPNALQYSARSGECVNPQPLKVEPNILIWGVGRNRQVNCQWPQFKTKPQLIVDLNYNENSPGLEYAVNNKINYESGLSMFKHQAQKQREFWSNLL